MAKTKKGSKVSNGKISQLNNHSEESTDQFLTTNQGVKINDNQNSLKAGERGSTLLEDFILREKITHFDHERIPERIVHARGSAAHGVFKVYESMAGVTKAGFLQNPAKETPVFVRFSTVAGSRGSSDLARDVRGFAVKFYTEEGNFDIVGNNMPVFFIQDAMKFPDLIHAVKPEPDNEMPQAASAHDTFWDFISLMPESAHMIMWVMSDRALPRSYRMMEGFGVHSFRFINEKGKASFVKFHWKPLLGVHSITWDEAQKISGKDPDFHRRDLWEAIESGNFPEWELGVQIIAETDEHKFDFDLLDPTKLIPEELVPVKRIGKLTLNRNPDNFFAETEQVAFHVGNIVPGIDFTNDPLMQGRLFSYTDTQLIRLGGPNFHEIPINRPIAPVHNNQRDGFMRQTINKGKTSYQPNTIAGGCPYQAMLADGGFTSHAEKIDAKKVRDRSKSFMDHFSQARLFFNSQAPHEQDHIINALRFELGKLKIAAIRERMVGILSLIDKKLADQVATGLGVKVKSPERPINQGTPADVSGKKYEPTEVNLAIEKSQALSMAHSPNGDISTRKVAVLVADGFDLTSFLAVKSALEGAGAVIEVIAPLHGMVTASNKTEVPVQHSLLTASSVMYDALYIPGGVTSAKTLANDSDAVHFLNETYRHCKAIALHSDASELVKRSYIANTATDIDGVITGNNGKQIATQFKKAIGQHRFWQREKERKVPA
ncbi:MAG: catalase [Bacteroidota bacterium]